MLLSQTRNVNWLNYTLPRGYNNVRYGLPVLLTFGSYYCG